MGQCYLRSKRIARPVPIDFGHKEYDSSSSTSNGTLTMNIDFSTRPDIMLAIPAYSQDGQNGTVTVRGRETNGTFNGSHYTLTGGYDSHLPTNRVFYYIGLSTQESTPVLSEYAGGCQHKLFSNAYVGNYNFSNAWDGHTVTSPILPFNVNYILIDFLATPYRNFYSSYVYWNHEVVVDEMTSNKGEIASASITIAQNKIVLSGELDSGRIVAWE